MQESTGKGAHKMPMFIHIYSSGHKVNTLGSTKYMSMHSDHCLEITFQQINDITNTAHTWTSNLKMICTSFIWPTLEPVLMCRLHVSMTVTYVN